MSWENVQKQKFQTETCFVSFPEGGKSNDYQYPGIQKWDERTKASLRRGSCELAADGQSA